MGKRGGSLQLGPMRLYRRKQINLGKRDLGLCKIPIPNRRKKWDDMESPPWSRRKNRKLQGARKNYFDKGEGRQPSNIR